MLPAISRTPATRTLSFVSSSPGYWRNAAFLEENQLLRDAATLDGIPGVLIHGRFDVSGPLETAWHLSQRWATSRLQVIDDAGHGGGGIGAAIEAALAEFAS